MKYWEPLIPVKLVVDSETTGHTEVNYPFPSIFDKINEELIRATGLYGSFTSRHQGYGVILEELDELWTAIKERDKVSARAEAIQLTAMGIRFLLDLDDLQF